MSDTFGIGQAVKEMENGNKVARAGWNGKGMHLALQVPDEHSKMTERYVYMRTAQGGLIPWLCSQADLLARDWVIVLLALFLLPFAAHAQTVLGSPAPAAPPTPNWVTAILQYLVVPLLPVIGTMVLALLGKLTLFLHAKGKTSKTAEAFAVATDFFSTALSHIRAGIEPDLKAALADGTLDATERASLKAKILALVKAELPASVTGLLSGVLGPALETWLSGRAEQVIDQAVASSAALATPAAVPS